MSVCLSVHQFVTSQCFDKMAKYILMQQCCMIAHRFLFWDAKELNFQCGHPIWGAKYRLVNVAIFDQCLCIRKNVR